MDLKTLQSQFATLLQEQNTKVLALSLEKEISGAGTLSAEKALQVYQNAYIARLTEALGETFESLWWVLGDDQFFKICKEYIYATPSKSPNLSDYGEELPNFLGSTELARELKFLYELSMFEWCFKELFHKEGLDFEKRTQLDTRCLNEELVVKFYEPIKLMHFEFPIYDLWKLRKTDPQKIKNDQKTDFSLKSSQRILIFKNGPDNYILELDHDQYFIAEGILNSRSLGRIFSDLGQFTESDSESTQKSVSELFLKLSVNRLITSVN